MDLLTFEEALEDAQDYAVGTTAPHVLLGNGFSIACRPDKFTYGALLDEADLTGASTDLHALFGLLGTTDFERVIDLLELSAELVEAYESADPGLATRLREDAEVVRGALANVLAAKHPDVPYDIDDDEYESARKFLSHFERIYTLNYDMLLYWSVMQDGDPQPQRNDGFGNPEDESASYVVWDPYAVFRDQRVFYLHGSLHLYESGAELAKITWSRTQVPLVDQIREALDEGRYPLIVTEGNSTAKLAKILHSAYLNHAIRSFSMIGGSLFLYGLSLAQNDEHFLQRIADGALKALYVSVFGDPDSPANRAVVAAAEALATQRPATRPLAVKIYDAASADVWT